MSDNNTDRLKCLGDQLDRLLREYSIPGSRVTKADLDAAQDAYDDELVRQTQSYDFNAREHGCVLG